MITNIYNSEGLNKSFKENTNPEIKERLGDLLALGIDPGLFAKFEKRVDDILSINPEIKDIAMQEIEKTQIAFESLNIYSKARIKGVLNNASYGDDLEVDVA